MSNLDFNTNPITEQEVIALLGNQFKAQGQELVWRCPACPGGDKSGDNLKFNRQKQILHCFACNYAEEICEIIARRRYEASQGASGEYAPIAPRQREVEPPQEVEKEKEIKQEHLWDYYLKCHYRLMKRKDLLKKLFEKHGVLPTTAASCFIGYDDTKDMLVFPSLASGKDPTENAGTEPNGAEYREYEGQKIIRRISGYDSRICRVHGQSFAMFGIICEGYKDAYNLVQLMKITDSSRLNCTNIYTVQNGTNSINSGNCLQKVNWNRFEEIGLLMDNDEAGSKATEIARTLFPKMKDLRETYLAGHNDIAERFKVEIGCNVQIDIALQAEWLKEYENEG